MDDTLMAETLRQILADLRALQEGQARLDGQGALAKEAIGQIRQSVIRLELTETPKTAAALDGIAANEEALRRLEQRIARLEKEVGRHAMELVAAQMVN